MEYFVLFFKGFICLILVLIVWGGLQLDTWRVSFAQGMICYIRIKVLCHNSKSNQNKTKKYYWHDIRFFYILREKNTTNWTCVKLEEIWTLFYWIWFQIKYFWQYFVNKSEDFICQYDFAYFLLNISYLIFKIIAKACHAKFEKFLKH